MFSAGKLQIADNLDKVSQQLIDYILQAKSTLEGRLEHKRELLNLLQEVREVYHTSGYRFPLLSAIAKNVHKFSRQRMPDINEAIDMLEATDANEKIFMLDVIVGLLKQGSCEPSSANTQLLIRLVGKLNQYARLEEDKRLSAESRTSITEVLRDIFVIKSEQTILAYQAFIERNKAVLQTEKPIVGKLRVPDDVRNKLDNLFGKKPESRKVADANLSLPNIKDNEKYAPVMAKLEIFIARRAKETAVNVTRTPEVVAVPVPAAVVCNELVGTPEDRAKKFADTRAQIGLLFNPRNHQSSEGLSPLQAKLR